MTRAVVLAMVAGLTAACSQGHIHLQGAASTTTAPVSSKKGVLAAWDHYEAVVAADAAKADPKDPRLAQLSTGDELRKTRAFLSTLKTRGLRAVGPEDHHPRVTHLGPTLATVADCNFDHTKLVNASGKVVGPPATKAHLLTATLVRKGSGPWKVSEVAGEQPACTP